MDFLYTEIKMRFEHVERAKSNRIKEKVAILTNGQDGLLGNVIEDDNKLS